MNKLLCALSIILTLVLLQDAVGNTIKMGYFLLPPFQYEDRITKKARGASIRHFEEVAARIGYKVQWIGPLPLLRLSEMLEKGRLDGSVLFAKNPYLERFLHYPDLPVFFAQPTIFVSKQISLTQVKSIDDIKGFRIGTVVSMSGRYTQLIDRHRDKITIEPIGADLWIEQNLHKLSSGRVDAIFDRQPYSVPFVAAGLRFKNRIKSIPLPDPPAALYIVFGRRSKQGETLVRRCNKILSRSDITVEELVRQELESAMENK